MWFAIGAFVLSFICVVWLLTRTHTAYGLYPGPSHEDYMGTTVVLVLMVGVVALLNKLFDTLGFFVLYFAGVALWVTWALMWSLCTERGRVRVWGCK